MRVRPHTHGDRHACGCAYHGLSACAQLACMHFPFYVAMWFGTTPDEALVDPGFPRRFVPRAFDALLRHNAASLLPEKMGPGGHPQSPPRAGIKLSVPADELQPLPTSHEDNLTFAYVPMRLQPAAFSPSHFVGASFVSKPSRRTSTRPHLPPSTPPPKAARR